VAGAAVSLLMTMKGLPLAYNKDMQETQEPVFDAAETATMLVRMAAGFMTDAGFNYPAMQAAAQSGFMNAMAAAAYLVKRGVPFRYAHQQIGNAVQFAIEKGCELQELTLEELQRFSPEFAGDIYANLTLEAVLGCHDVAGGTAPEQVKQALTAGKRQVREFFSSLPQEVVHAGA
jgi:argininosuccinate lyase